MRANGWRRERLGAAGRAIASRMLDGVIGAVLPLIDVLAASGKRAGLVSIAAHLSVRFGSNLGSRGRRKSLPLKAPSHTYAGQRDRDCRRP